MTVKIVLLKAKKETRKKGTSIIYVRYTHREVSVLFSTGVSTVISHFNEATGMIEIPSVDDKFIRSLVDNSNYIIDESRKKILLIAQLVKAGGRDPDVETVKGIYEEWKMGNVNIEWAGKSSEKEKEKDTIMTMEDRERFGFVTMKYALELLDCSKTYLLKLVREKRVNRYSFETDREGNLKGRIYYSIKELKNLTISKK